MTQWYVKDLSKLTGISVQTLHHYDRIDLLKPSVRLSNGYRVYTEKDLLKLQQIIALKFLGFELSQIKAFLTNDADMIKHFSVQAKLLEQKSRALLDASQVLRSIITDVSDDKSISWETIIQLIEVYRMTQNFDHAWVKDIFTPNELKQYAAFETELKNRYSPEQKTEFENHWASLVSEIKNNLYQDPNSEIGRMLASKCMTLINGLYGKKYAHLRTKKFEKGFAEGKGLAEVGLTQEMVSWLEKATDAYWRDRIYGLLSQLEKLPNATSLTLWYELLDEMYGEDIARKKALYALALEDTQISETAKAWLRDIMPSLH